MNFIYRSVQFGFMHIWPALVLVISAFFLPSNSLGSVAIVMSVATLFRPLMGMSLGKTVMRSVGELRAIGDDIKSEKLINTTIRLGLVLSLPMIAIAGLSVVFSNGFYSLGLSNFSILSAIAFIMLFGITEFFDGILRVQGLFRTLAISVASSRIFGIVLFLTFLPFFPSLDCLLIILAMSELIATALLIGSAVPAFRSGSAYSIYALEAKSLIVSSFPVIINALSVYFYARAMVLIVGAYDTSSNVGAFELAVQITNLPMAVTIICATVISPAIARLYAQGEEGREVASRLISYAGAFSVWSNAIAAAFMVIVGPFLVSWLIPEVKSAPIVLFIVAPLIFAKSFAQIISGEISIVTGNVKTSAFITISSGILTVLVGVALARSYGVVGAAFAILITHLISVIATIIFLGKRIKLKISYRLMDSLITIFFISIPTIPVVLYYAGSPATAALAGSLVFFASLLLLIFTSVKFNLSIHEPILDGIRMLKSKSAHAKEEFFDISREGGNDLYQGRGFRNGIWELIKIKSPSGYDFWVNGNGDLEEVPLQDHADIIYSAFLLGDTSKLSSNSAQEYLNKLSVLPLYGKSPNPILAHLTAYLLGGARLIEGAGLARAPDELYDGWREDLLIEANGLPRWPRAWSHHIWRVSHWIGGIPSILLHLSDSQRVNWATERLTVETLSACERHIIVESTGLLRPYKSKFIQFFFRKLYSLRHSPEVADIGGVVHLLWVYHALGRGYIGNDSLLEAATRHLYKRPFIEDVPYCLDFDVVQLKRTAVGPKNKNDENRAKDFGNDISDFFRKPVSSTYTLHKIPGALATMHEAALIEERSLVRGLEIPPIDIIKHAYWL